MPASLPLDYLLLRMEERGVSADIRSRVRRLNSPTIDDGAIPRGIHYKQSVKWVAFPMALVPKGEFLRRYGRTAWRDVPAQAKRKFGRREMVRIGYVHDAGLKRIDACL